MLRKRKRFVRIEKCAWDENIVIRMWMVGTAMGAEVDLDYCRIA